MSTETTNAAVELAKRVDAFVLEATPFFELAENEIRKQNSTDFDNLEFLIKAFRKVQSDFAADTWEIYGDDKLLPDTTINV